MSGGGKGQPAGPPLRVKCPRCGRRTPYQDNPWRPFCSERCKLIDLGQWAEEKYSIASEDSAPLDDGEG